MPEPQGETPSGSSQGSWKGLWKRWRNRFLIDLTGYGARALLGTCRYRLTGEDTAREARSAAEAPIFLMWHEGIICGLGSGFARGLTSLSSTGRDGRFAATIVERHFGLDTLPGSSSRGAVSAARRMSRDPSRSMVITPDGPRGPRHVAAPGALWVAHRCGRAIVPVGVAVDRAWVLGSWDRLRVPKPFARIAIHFGEPYWPGSEDAQLGNVAAAGAFEGPQEVQRAHAALAASGRAAEAALQAKEG